MRTTLVAFVVQLMLARSYGTPWTFNDNQKIEEDQNPGSGIERNLQMVPISEHPFELIIDTETFDADVETATKNEDDWTTEGSIDDKIATVKTSFLKMQAYMSDFFNITFQDELKFPDTKCSGNKYQLGAKYLRKADFYLFVFLQNNPNSESPVQAINCLSDKSNGRPVVGIFLINMLKVPDTAPDSYQLFKRFLHEFFHMLGFSSYVFQNFPGTSAEGELTATANLTTEGGQTVPISYFTKEEVKTAAQTYFSCPSIQGLPLDYSSDDNPIGNHLSFLQLPYSLMNPVPSIDPVIDNLTITVLSSTGWYKVDLSAAEKDMWEGFDNTFYTPEDACDTVNKVCPATLHRCLNEQANDSALRCSPDRTTKQLCAVHPKFGNITSDLQCPFWQKTTMYCREEVGTHDNWNGDIETRSDSSLCFMMYPDEVSIEDLEPRCLKYECALDDLNQTLLILKLANGTNINCTQAELLTIVDADDPTKILTADCPDPLSLCPDTTEGNTTQIATCGFDCSTGGLGICMSTDECYCFFGKNDTSGGCNEYVEVQQSQTTTSSQAYEKASFMISLYLILMGSLHG